MAREAAPTRWPARHGPLGRAANPRVDAGVKELNEMTIGRTEDPENPSLAPAFVAASLFGAGPRNPSGPADMVPRQQAGHMHAIDHPSRSFSSCIPGAVHTCELIGWDRFGVDTPDLSHTTLFNSQGNVEKVQAFWRQKLARVAATERQFYAET